MIWQGKRVFAWLGIFVLLIMSSACTHMDHRQGNKGYIPSSASSSSSGGSCQSPYRVQRGQTLSVIAQRCSVDMYKMADLNHMGPPYRIYVGQELLLPSRSDARAPSADLTPSKQTPTASGVFAWPMKRREHEFVADAAGNHALVIKAPAGEGVYAVADGEVVYAGDGIRHFGRMVILKHDNHYLTVYAHNNTLAVKEKQQVKQGQLISTVGSTGTVKTPQLYLEVRYRGRKVDAKPLFRP